MAIFRFGAALAALFVSTLACGQAIVNESLETAFLYVDAVNGNDANPGTQLAPLKTISAAAAIALTNNKAGVGTRVTINPGTYRESISLAALHISTAAPMTFQAATNGTVFVSGAVPFQNWSATGNPYIFAGPWPNRWGFCDADGGNAPWEAPIVLRREMLFVNGVPMTQVLAPSQMVFPGTFFVDETGAMIYLWPPAGTNLATVDVEVASLPTLLSIKSLNGVVIRGITFEYAASCHGSAAATVGATNVLFDSDAFLWNNGQGLAFANPAANVTVSNSISNHNGATGFQSWEMKNVLWRNITASYNNWRGAQGAYYTWNTGGAHIFSNHNETYSGFTAAYNQTWALHWDTDVQNASTDSLHAVQNLAGVLDEKTQGPVTLSNSVFCGNPTGLGVRNSSALTLTGNTFYNNGLNQIAIVGTPGGLPISNWETGQGYNLVTQNLTMRNNAFVAVGPSQQAFQDGSLGGTDWSAFLATLHSDYNTWWNASDATPFTVPAPKPGSQISFSSWQSLTGQDSHSTFSPPVNNPSAACFVAADAPDWWLTVDDGTATTDPSGNAVFNLANTALGGWSGVVSLAVDGVAAIPGASVKLAPSRMSTNGGSALTFSAGANTTPGTYAFTVLANSGNVTRTLALSATVPVTAVRLSSTSLLFANQPIEFTSPAQTVTVTNTGRSTLGIASIAVTSGFAQTNTCGASVGAGATCAITVVFTPHNLTPYSGSLTIVDSDATSPQTVSLAGTVVGAPSLSFSPRALSFGGVVFLTPSAPAGVTTLTNTGSAPMNLAGVAITGANSGDFAQINHCVSPLAVGASCVFSVVFTPRSTGPRSANLTFTDDALGSPQTVALAGAGNTAVLLSRQAIDFGSVPLGKSSGAKTVTITNLSAANLTIGPLILAGLNPGDFNQTNNCGRTLAGEASCTVSIAATPQAAGVRSASLAIADSDPSTPQIVALTTLVTTAPAASLAPASLSFGSVVFLASAPARTATLTNTGSAPLLISSVALTGANAADFSQTNNCGGSVAPGATCGINVTFTPRLNGPRTANLNVATNAAGSPSQLCLSGSGSTAISVSPKSVGFGTVKVGTASSPANVTITNLSTAAIAVNALTITGANATDFSQSNTCGSRLAGGASCAVSLTMRPKAAGSRSASLAIADADPLSPQSVALTGTGK